jgi:hypothetical protein
VITDCTARGEPVPSGEPPHIREITVTAASDRADAQWWHAAADYCSEPNDAAEFLEFL